MRSTTAKFFNATSKMTHTYAGTQSGLLGLLFFVHTFLLKKDQLSPENTMNIFYGILGASALATALQLPKAIVDQRFIYLLNKAQKSYLNNRTAVKNDILKLKVNIDTLLKAIKTYNKHSDINELLAYTKLLTENPLDNLKGQKTQLVLPARRHWLRGSAHSLAGLAQAPLNFLHFANVLVFILLTVKLLGTGLPDLAWQVISGAAALLGVIGLALSINQQYANYREPLERHTRLQAKLSALETRINALCDENAELAQQLENIIKLQGSKLSSQQLEQLSAWLAERRVNIQQISTFTLDAANPRAAEAEESQSLLPRSGSDYQTHSVNSL